MVQDKDFDGYFRKCLQCGRIVDLGMEVSPLKVKSEERLAA